MAIIKSYSPLQNLSNYGTFITDVNPNSDYFRITEFNETFTGGKNGFLIEGSEHLKETTEIKIEILDVEGNPIYYEPGNGVPEYYEGISKLVSVHVYEDTPIGIGKITILGELKTYEDASGVIRDIPTEWRGAYNVKWEKTFQINKNLTNETRVRFYRRPTISIDEIVKPIYNVTTPYITRSGSVDGISEIPIAGTDLSRWTAGTLYKLKRVSGDGWTASIDENTITLPDLGYTTTVKEVLNTDEILVDIPYTLNNIVTNFTQSSWTSSFEYLDGQTFTESALTGSFAKINISNLKTFVGDVARVKIFRKSRNDVGDYVLVQESKLESTELLRDLGASGTTDISYGNFTQTNLETYWTGSSNLHPTINLDKLYASVKPADGYSGVQTLYTTQSVSVTKDVEYTLTFKTLYSGSVDNTKSLRAYLSSSTYTQDFLTLSGSAIYQTKQDITKNIIANPISGSVDTKLVFEFSGSGWHVSNVSLKNAQETSFSPDEFTIVQDVSKNVSTETFDFRFEFYDINNNYIPVDVFATKQFTGGNNFPTSAKILLLQSDKSAFRFTTGSVANPPFQQIGFTTTRQNIAGGITYGRSVFDITGSYIEPTHYSQSNGTIMDYPGALHSSNDAGFIVQIDEFSGSLDVPGSTNLIRVGFITYTASGDGLEEYETIYRLEDGDNAPGLFASSTANQFIYKATNLSLNPSTQVITFDVRRKNLGVSGTTITINSGSQFGVAAPLTLLADDPSTAVATYYLSGSTFNYTSGSATYFFSASDGYGIDYHDTIKITPIKILDGLSVTLTNENATLPAKSTGFVESGSFSLTSGSVSVKVGNETITFDDEGDGQGNNTFAIISVSGTTGISVNSSNPTTNEYGITTLNGVDSGSINVVVRYKDGSGDTTDVTKVVTYTKAKRGVPNVVLVATPQAQSVLANSSGVQTGTLSNVTIDALEGSTSRFTSMVIDSTSGFSTPPTVSTNTLVMTSAVMNASEASITLSVTHTDSESTTGQTKTIIVRTTKVVTGADGAPGTNGTDGTDGADGPGVVFRGPWSSTTTYYDTDDYPTRRDAVLYNGTYYATKTNATTNLNKQPDTQTAFWESLGTDSYFVAAEIAIFRESYVKETINVGTNSGGNANITIAGGTTSPYISIGQSTKGYNQTGAWIGSDGTNGKLSLKSASNSLLWDGTNLTITGGGTFSGALSAASGTFTGALSGGTISIGSGDSIFKADSNGIYLGNATFASAPFRVTPAGVLTTTSGTIGGWTIGLSTLTGGNATLASSGNITLGTSNNVVRLSADDADYRIWVGNATAGDAPFRVTKGGAVTATNLTLSGGSLTIGSGGTYANINSSGKLTAANVDVSGRITATEGFIGDWVLTGPNLYASVGTKKLQLAAGRPAMELYDGASVVVDVNANTALSDKSAGSISPSPTTLNSYNEPVYYAFYDNHSGPTYSYTNTPDNLGPSQSTFTISSGNSLIGQTCTISAIVSGGSNSFVASGDDSHAKYLEYMEWRFSYGFKLVTPSQTIYVTTPTLYGEVLHQIGDYTMNASYGTFTLSTSVTLEAGTYYITPVLNNVYAAAILDSPNLPGPATFQVYMRTPLLSSISAAVAVSKTELCAGGFQVVYDTTKYLEVKRANETDFVKIGGGLTVTGDVTANTSSDIKLKENLIKIENPLEKLSLINGYTYDWKEGFEEIHTNKGNDIGVIAQEIELILPQLVTTRDNGFKAVRYDKIVALLIEGIKELSNKTEELQEEIKQLKEGK